MEDRAEAPGLRYPPLDTTNARQLTHHLVQSTAVHSRSMGWLPRIKLDLYHKPLSGPGEEQVVELIIDPKDLQELNNVMNVAMARAWEDAKRGIVEAIPEPGSGQHRRKRKK